jgi:hypothetical protein
MKRSPLVALVVAVGAVLAATPAHAGARTPISVTSALQFVDPPGCDHSRQRPCADTGTFVANDAATAALLCPQGTMAESFYFPTHGRAFTIAERTATCPDGSTLLLHVERTTFTELSDVTAEIGETWRVELGTGRFSLLHGRGTMTELFSFAAEPNSLGGTITGVLRSAGATTPPAKAASQQSTLNPSVRSRLAWMSIGKVGHSRTVRGGHHPSALRAH